LAKVIEYCKFHTEAKAKETSEDDAKNFDTEFVKVDQATLFELILVRTAPRVRALGRARSRTGRDEISPLKRALFRALILISFSRGPVRFR
jgi:S-phase kinase-associated protein 1|tara:strand:- start:1535 stop:1807 length:273 start_codon:yes stop_codon:yes gene_type:complete